MDDYNISTLTDSKNEWCARLTNILTPCLIEGMKSVFDEAYKICSDNDEEEKYLMTFQNLLNNIPKWSAEIVATEKDRIIGSSGCNYLEDLLTCVHITQLKSLTSSRAGLKQKKVNIDIPNIDIFIHKAYINIARKVYVNVYLFEANIMPLQIQKNNRELELIVKECILNTIRENIPVENILKIYLDETQETDVVVEEKKETIVDKEALEKMNKLKQKEELETLKKEVSDKLKADSKKSLTQSIEKANKSINDTKTNETKTNEDKSNEIKTTKSLSNDLESNDLEKSDNELTDYSSDNDSKINLDSDLESVNDDVLDIKTLDDDPDKLDLEILDIDKKEANDEDSIVLDIEEL
jgi:hypothetical protein